MGLFEALFLGGLEVKDPMQAPTVDLERWALNGIAPGSAEAEVGRALGRPSSWWAKRKGRWLYPNWSLWVTCEEGQVDTIEIDLTGTLGVLLGGSPTALVQTFRRGGEAEAGPPTLAEAKALFPDATITEDPDEVMFQAHQDGVGLDFDFDLEQNRLERVSFYLDPEKKAVPIHEA